MSLKTGIVGCGKVGDFHAKAYSQLGSSAFAAVCDADLDRARAFAERYHVRAYADVAEMIQTEGLDVVSICTPHPAHCGPAVTAAENGCNVLIEKPLASSLEDCDRIIAAGERHHVTIGTMVQRRFYRPCMRIHEAIQAGKIGRPILGMVTMLGWRDRAYYNSDGWRGTWQGEGGGVLVNQAPHQLDLLLWYMGEVEQVYGVWKNFNHPYIEVEDTALAVVKFKSGAVGNIVVSNSQNPALYGKVHIFGENGAGVGVQTDGGAMFIAGMSAIAEPPCNDLWTVPGEADLLEGWKQADCDFFNRVDSMYYYHREQIADFLRAFFDTHRLKPHAVNAVYLRQGMPVDWAACRDEPAMQDFRLACETCRAIGSRYVVVVPPLDPSGVFTGDADAAQQDCVRILKQLSALARPYGVRLCFELVGLPKSCVRDIAAADRIVRAVDEDNVGFVFDSYNIYLNGRCNDFSGLRAVQPEKIFAVHLMSADDVPEEQMGQDKRCFPGRGVVDTSAFLQTLRACGYEGMVSVETFRPEYWARPPRWVVENACRTLRQALEESGCL